MNIAVSLSNPVCHGNSNFCIDPGDFVYLGAQSFGAAVFRHMEAFPPFLKDEDKKKRPPEDNNKVETL